MNILKSKHRLLLIMCVAFITFGLVATAGAWNRPANPTMDYVPQNVGIYDTYYKNFKESDCRVCHGASTAPRHHSTDWALDGNCLYCHNEFPVVIPPVRNCKECHDDNWSKHPDLYGYPHHSSGWANADNCVKCHDPNLLVETNTVLPPGYEPSETTPSPLSCENCHWPSGNAPHEAETPDGDAAKFLSDWQTWMGSPKPTTYPTGDDPQPIEPNGPVKNGVLWAGGLNSQRPDPWFMPAKPYQPGVLPDLFRGLHHETNGLVRPKCYNCHANNPDSDPSYDPLNPYLIRMCENCHDRFTLHAISEHVTTNDIYTLNSTLTNEVTDGNKCVACHGDAMGPLPPPPTTIAEIKRIEPNTGGTGKVSFGSPGITLALIPTAAGNFPASAWNGQLEIVGDEAIDGNGDNDGICEPKKCTLDPGVWCTTNPECPSVGSLCTVLNQEICIGDEDGICDTGEPCVVASEAVEISGVDSASIPTTIDAPVDPDKWTDTKIEFKIPGWTFKAGSSVNISVRQLKDTGGTLKRKLVNSVAVTATVNKHPEINSITPSTGSYGYTLVLKGVGFDSLGIAPATEKIYNLVDSAGNLYGYSTYVELKASNDTYRIIPSKTVLKNDKKIKITLQKMLDVNTGAEVPPDQLYASTCWEVTVITDYIKDNQVSGTVGSYNLGLGGLDTADTLIWREESDPICFNSENGPFIQFVSPNKQNAKKYVSLTGYNFGADNAANKVNVGAKVVSGLVGPYPASITTWNDTNIVFKVPTLASYPSVKPVYVTRGVDGKVSNKNLTLKVKAPAP